MRIMLQRRSISATDTFKGKHRLNIPPSNTVILLFLFLLVLRLLCLHLLLLYWFSPGPAYQLSQRFLVILQTFGFWWLYWMCNDPPVSLCYAAHSTSLPAPQMYQVKILIHIILFPKFPPQLEYSISVNGTATLKPRQWS